MPFTFLAMTKYDRSPIWNGKACRIPCLLFWPIVLGNAPLRQVIVGECRSVTSRIGTRKMIHDRMLSWQLASLRIAHSLKLAVTPGGSPPCCGELVASSPKQLSNQLLMPPCSFASRSVLPPNFPRKDQAVDVGKA